MLFMEQDDELRTQLSSTPLAISEEIKSSNRFLIILIKTLTRASEFGTIKNIHDEIVLQNLRVVQ